jgi:hypothetical protein
VYEHKKHAQELLRKMLHGEVPIDHDLLGDLVLMHPNAVDKVGCGIAYFSTIAAIAGSTCFLIHRIDGSTEDFSIKKCMSSKEAIIRSDVYGAMRWAIYPQIVAFRHGLPQKTKCSITGVPMMNNEGHVDHIYPYVKIATEFIDLEGISMKDIELIAGDMPDKPRELVDAEFSARWQAYHELIAKLRLTTSHANLSRLRK